MHLEDRSEQKNTDSPYLQKLPPSPIVHKLTTLNPKPCTLKPYSNILNPKP